MVTSECSETSKVEMGSSGGGADGGASSSLAVVVELQATIGLPTSPQMAKELLAAAVVEDSPSVEVLTPELPLAIAFEVLHRLETVEMSMSLSKEALDLAEILVAHVISLSSSLACKMIIVESSLPHLMACEVVDLQSNLIVPPASPPPPPM
jgi:hypothetical protein